MRTCSPRCVTCEDGSRSCANAFRAEPRRTRWLQCVVRCGHRRHATRHQCSHRGVHRTHGAYTVIIASAPSCRRWLSPCCRDHISVLLRHILDQKSPGLSPGGARAERPSEPKRRWRSFGNRACTSSAPDPQPSRTREFQDRRKISVIGRPECREVRSTCIACARQVRRAPVGW